MYYSSLLKEELYKIKYLLSLFYINRMTLRVCARARKKKSVEQITTKAINRTQNDQASVLSLNLYTIFISNKYKVL